MTRVLLIVTLAVLISGLTARAFAYEQARAGTLTEREEGRLSEVARTVEARSADSRSVSVSTPSAGEPNAGIATLSAPQATAVERTDGAPVSRPVTSQAASPAAVSSRTASLRWPTREAMRWQPPHGFLRAAFCVHRHESVDWYRAYVDWRGQPSPYSGGMQFTLSTWQRAGGKGHPHQWRPREQVYRAWRIWRLNGGSWREWGTAWKCGLA